MSVDPKASAGKDKEAQQEDWGHPPVGVDLLNGWIETGTAKYPGQSLMVPKIASVFMTKTMTELFLRTKPRKDPLPEAPTGRGLKYQNQSLKVWWSKQGVALINDYKQTF